MPGPSLKRKRAEIADSQSEDEELGSDEEFGWADDVYLAPGGFMEHDEVHEKTGNDINGNGKASTDDQEEHVNTNS